MTDSVSQLHQLLNNALIGGQLRKAVLSRPRQRSNPELRLDARPVQVRSQILVQLTTRTRTQEFHRNLDPATAAYELCRKCGDVYRDVRLETSDAVWEARFSKKNDCRLRQLAHPAAGGSVPEPPLALNENSDSSLVVAALGPGLLNQDPAVPTSGAQPHNRARNYLIPDGVPCPFLIHSGVMTAEGKVRAKHYHKFRQINRYLEFVCDVMHRLPHHEPIRVVDFGCGKSYLTFATHYLMQNILHRDCQITGLDRRADVIDSCRSAASQMQLSGIDFQVSDIADFVPGEHVHLVISLHACDTATDDALFQAVRWNSDVILAAPCCQHELAGLLPRSAMPFLLQHGILHERFAAMATDALRATALTAAGYDTQVVEFIDLEHTAKNLLIRAFRTPAAVPPAASGLPGTQSASRSSVLDADSIQQREALEQLHGVRRLLQVPPLSLEAQLRTSGCLPTGD